VDTLLDRHPNDGRVAIGLDATLSALADGRVRMLLIAGDGPIAGSACTSCGRLAERGGDTCPVCEAPMVPVDDVSEPAVRRALEYGSGIRFISGEAASQLAERSGAIAALLRY
jgi:peptide subunit release factor 1 (eRF1)